MKRLIALFLACAVVLSACSHNADTPKDQPKETALPSAAPAVPVEAPPEISPESPNSVADAEPESEPEPEPEPEQDAPAASEMVIPEFSDMDSPELQQYVEDSVYISLLEALDSDEYFVENVSAAYISQEYLNELSYNSQVNIFFGYTLQELDEQFQGTRYMFTLGDDGQTIVKPLEEYDDTYDQVLKNVAIGGGVIVLCVTVSVVTAGAGAPAASMIFAMGAKSAATMALTSGAMGGVVAGITTGIETKDFSQALDAAALAASEGFKWGAITGAIAGSAGEAFALHQATLNGLTMNQAAELQQATKWPLEAISALHSPEEAEIYIKAGLTPKELTVGKLLTREIDWNLTDAFGHTNVERVGLDLAPVDPSGMPYELHHIGMRADSPLAILTNAEHHASDTYKILHYKEEGKDIADAVWPKQKKQIWRELLKLAQLEGRIT